MITPAYLQGVEGRHSDFLRDAGFEISFPAQGADLRNPEALTRQLAGVDAVLASIEPYTAQVLEASRLRVISRCGVGYDAIDVAAATRVDVLVANTPGANKEGVAEHTIALMLAVAHGFPRRDRELRAGRWNREAMPRLAGQTVGLVGLGAIGKEVALRCQALGMNVIAMDPAADEAWATEHSIRLLDLEALLEQADVVSLHLPCTGQTAGLFDAAAFARMKSGAIFINTARGALVDEAALVDALRSGKLSGAGLDVFQQEPLPDNHPLLGLDNALLCPHMAGLDFESRDAMATLAAQNITELYQGRWPEGRVVNAGLARSWKW
jgi:phosphoglycerate dehydrogenase-like enzyme